MSMKKKKVWKTPTLTIHGNVEDITQHGGGAFYDVHFGDPVTGDVPTYDPS